MKYRREIDGLRAIAIIPVMLFHAGFEIFRGGFVGVDIFFVISGYLITAIIIAEKEAGNFSLADFYERRARRILPALFFMLTVCLPLAWIWLPPSDLKEFSQSILAVTVFSSNVLFWQTSGYFDTAAELKPMLHTWSLAVEEQYYMLFPLWIMLAWRFGKKWIVTALAVVAVASLAASQWSALHKPAAAFFLLPSRGWELLVGSFVAFYFARKERPVLTECLAEVGSSAGLALIVYAIFAFDKNTAFPGWHALFPTVGAALIILFATPVTWVGRLLGHRAFVGIGLISYSAYLWHQPLFVFARHRSLDMPSAMLYAALSVVTLGLAWLSWRFVERPFRDKRAVGRGAIIRFGLGGSFVLVLFSVVGISSNGYFLRHELEATLGDVESRLRINYGLSSGCDHPAGIFSKDCSTGDQPEILVWGDSYAMHLMPGLLASKKDIKVVQMTSSFCGPFLDIAPLNEKYKASWAVGCLAFNDRVFEWLRQNKSVKYVVLSSPFGQFVDKNARVMRRSGEVVSGSEVSMGYFKTTLDRIKSLGVTPVVFSPTPQNGTDMGRCSVKVAFFHLRQDLCAFDLAVATARQQPVVEFLQRIEQEVKVVWLFDGICTHGTCVASQDNIFIYRDDGHLSIEGSAYMGKKINFYEAVTTGRSPSPQR
jgi:peptidoglycan/LPS O-acetylase OafA/YrhL